MHVYSPHALEVLHDLAREHGALVIHDEIATGFHRTGPLWAGAGSHRGGSEHVVTSAPDILCVGKALTGGYLSLAAVLCTSAVARGVSAGEAGGLMHGPTFMGNPLACAIASANLDLLAARDAAGEVTRIERGLSVGLERAASLTSVATTPMTKPARTPMLTCHSPLKIEWPDEPTSWPKRRTAAMPTSRMAITR